MRTIRLTESQLHRLIEKVIGAPNFENGDVKEYNGSEVTTTCNVTNQDGEKEYGKPLTTDKFGSNLTTQNNYGLNTRTSNHRMY
jgi:hypothetical protein